jgi:signal peptidase I
MAFDLKSVFKGASKEKKHGYDAHKTVQGKVWHFLAHEDSWRSFVVDAILILIIGKYLILPSLGLIFGTSFPLVAVVSSSMDHSGSFGEWWRANGAWYEENNITMEEFLEFPYENGFRKGDVFVVKGRDLDDVKIGDVIVYTVPGRADPIIHRVIDVEPNVLVTKGDANDMQLDFEYEIRRPQLQGVAVARLPYLGWVKVAFIELAGSLR